VSDRARGAAVGDYAHRRTNKLQVLLTDAELATLRDAAALRHMPTSVFVRSLAMDAAKVVLADAGESRS